MSSATALGVSAVRGRRPDRGRALASVIIPCFNQAHFLGDAIESALAQTHRPTEIVVVDDGSTDNTWAVAARFGTIDYISQPNRGLSAARNAGLDRCRGAYIVFLDADDKLLPEAIDVGVGLLEAHPECAFVSGHHRLIDVTGTVIQEWTRSLPEGDRYAAFLRGNYVSMCAAVLFRRPVFDEVGQFDGAYSPSEDYELYLRIARRFAVCEHGATVAEYRRHGDAFTDDPSRMLAAVLRVMHAQRHLLGHSATRKAAWNAGVAHWRHYYGQAALSRALGQFQANRTAFASLCEAIKIARLAPWEVVQSCKQLLAAW